MGHCNTWVTKNGLFILNYHNFKDYDDACKEADNLRKFIMKIAKTNNYEIHVIIGVSDIKPSLANYKPVANGKRGRNPRQVVIHSGKSRDPHVSPHIHMYFFATKPFDEIIKKIEKYMHTRRKKKEITHPDNICCCKKYCYLQDTVTYAPNSTDNCSKHGTTNCNPLKCQRIHDGIKYVEVQSKKRFFVEYPLKECSGILWKKSLTTNKCKSK